MGLYSIALKNIMRRKGKMMLIVISLSFSVAALFTIMSLISLFQADLDRELNKLGYTVSVKPASSNITLVYGGMSIAGINTYEDSSLNTDSIKAINKIADKHRARVSEKVIAQININGKQGLIVGTNLKQELSVKTWWRYFGRNPENSNEAISGSDAAKRFQLQPGSKISLEGRPFYIKAVLHETGSQDDNAIFVDLAAAQTALDQQGNVSLVEIAPQDINDSDKIAFEISQELPGLSITAAQQMLKYKQNTTRSMKSFGLLISLIIVVVSSVIVFITMSSSIASRKREIGVFKALGYRSSVIVKIVLSEVALLSTISGIVGLSVGTTIIYFLSNMLLSVAGFVFEPVVAAGVLILAIVIGLCGGFIPAKMASSVDPVDALKAF